MKPNPLEDADSERKQRCQAAIYVRDTYRVSRRPGPQFRMHYEKKQCSRAALAGGLCAQHAQMAGEHRNVERLDWYKWLSE